MLLGTNNAKIEERIYIYINNNTACGVTFRESDHSYRLFRTRSQLASLPRLRTEIKLLYQFWKSKI